MASGSKIKLFPSTALTATTTNGTAAQLQSSATDLICELSVTVIDAATTATCKVQHSPDGTRWYDLASFTAVAGSVSSELKFPSTASLLNLRATIALAGSTKSATLSIDVWFRDAR